MNITFIGCGNVGAPLADHLQRLGHSVTLAARDVQSQAVSRARARNAALLAASILALADPALDRRLTAWRTAQTDSVARVPVETTDTAGR